MYRKQWGECGYWCSGVKGARLCRHALIFVHIFLFICIFLLFKCISLFFSSSVFYRSSQRLRTHCVFSYDTTEDLSKDKNCVVDLYKVTLSENLFTPLSALHVVSQCFHLIGWKSDVSFQEYSQSQSDVDQNQWIPGVLQFRLCVMLLIKEVS